MAAVSGRDAVAFLDALAGQGLAGATLNSRATNLRVLFTWLTKRHELPEGFANPFAGKSRSTKPKVKRRAMTDHEIASLVGDAPLAREQAKRFRDAVPWLVLVAAYSGLRAGELCSLTPADIEQHDGFHVIHVRDGKTESATRQVPIHGELIKRGFLDYVETCKGPLFGVGAHRLAKSFPPYRRSRGVGSAETPFHSLRHSFVTALERAGVSSDDVARLAGHRHLLSFSFGTYSAPSLKRLAVAVALIEYPAVTRK